MYFFMKREKIVNGVKYACVNNPSYLKGENLKSCQKYIILYFDNKRWKSTGRFCNTIREFHESI